MINPKRNDNSAYHSKLISIVALILASILLIGILGFGGYYYILQKISCRGFGAVDPINQNDIDIVDGYPYFVDIVHGENLLKRYGIMISDQYLVNKDAVIIMKK